MQGQGESLRARAAEVARRLAIAHGVDEPEAGGDPTGALVSTILAQSTTDRNSSRAFVALRRRFPRWDDIRAAPTEEVAEAIRAGGLANVKAARIKACLDAIVERFGSLDLSSLRQRTLEEARTELRRLPGVGPKTAACVLLFDLGMPAVPVDTHVHRVSRRIGLIGPRVTPDAAHGILEAIVAPADAHAFHVGMVRHGRRICRAGTPMCSSCPLTDLCSFYHSGGAAQ